MYKCMICNNDTYSLVNTINHTNNIVEYRYCTYCFHIKQYQNEYKTNDNEQIWPKMENYLNIVNTFENTYNINNNDNITINSVDDLINLNINNKIYKKNQFIIYIM